jgi:hypothetical protein
MLNVHFHYMNVCALINVGLLLAAGAKSLCLRHKVTKSQVKKSFHAPCLDNSSPEAVAKGIPANAGPLF